MIVCHPFGFVSKDNRGCRQCQGRRPNAAHTLTSAPPAIGAAPEFQKEYDINVELLKKLSMIKKTKTKRKGRCPYDHVVFKDSLTAHQNIHYIEEIIASAGLKDFRYEIIEEVHLRNGRKIDSVILADGTDSTSGEMRSISVGLELKQHTSDLKFDNKIMDYLGYTDYFFLWLNNRRKMLSLLERYCDEPRIGVVMLKKESLVKSPEKQVVPDENRLTKQQISRGRRNRRNRLKYVKTMNASGHAERMGDPSAGTLPLPPNQS